MKLLINLFIFVVLFAACNNENSSNETIAAESKSDTVNYRAVIDETNKAFTTAALKGDSAAFVSTLYHPDANIYPPNESAVDVKTAASMMTHFPDMGVTAFTLNTKEVFEGDETVTEVGTYEMGNGSKTVDKGKYMVVWKKDGDKWKLFRDIWNSDNAYTPPPAASKKSK
jgi:ketosteroid isomerase-like protein